MVPFACQGGDDRLVCAVRRSIRSDVPAKDTPAAAIFRFARPSYHQFAIGIDRECWFLLLPGRGGVDAGLDAQADAIGSETLPEHTLIIAGTIAAPGHR